MKVDTEGGRKKVPLSLRVGKKGEKGRKEKGERRNGEKGRKEIWEKRRGKKVEKTSEHC